MNAARSFLLLIGDDGALLAPPLGTKPFKPLFAAGHGDDEAFPLLAAMADRPRVPVLILADTLTQEYRRDALPRLNIFDRKKLMTQRLRQYFPAPPSAGHGQLTAVLPLKNNAALFACLHDGGPVTAWMRRCEALRNRFAGVAPLPLASKGMVTALMPEARRGWAMLLSWQRTGGFRQIVTLDGDLAFTRLTPPMPTPSSPSYVTATLTLDLQATLDYLARLGFGDGMPLRLAALMPEEMHKALGTLPPPIETVVALSPHRAARRLDLPYAPVEDESTGDLLFAAWAARQKKLRPVLMPQAERESRQTARIRRWGRVAAVLAWLAALSVLAWQSHGLVRDVHALREARQDAAALLTQWNEERATLAPVTEPLGRLRQAVARKRLFSTPAPSPLPLLHALGAATAGAARATRYNWQTGEDGEAGVLDVSLSLTDDSLPVPDRESARQTIVRAFDRLAKNLRAALPGTDVTITRYPFLVKTDDTLSNAGDTSTVSSPPTADFRLREVKP